MSTSATTKIAAARLAPGMTVRLVGIEPLADHPLPTVAAVDLERGETHWVPCGALRPSGPVRTVAAVDLEDRRYWNLGSVRVTFESGEIVGMSTRQKVELLDAEAGR